MTVEYFDVDGVPGLYGDGGLPKTFPAGKQVIRYDVERFMNSAYPISKEKFDDMLATQKHGATEEDKQ